MFNIIILVYLLPFIMNSSNNRQINKFRYYLMGNKIEFELISGKHANGLLWIHLHSKKVTSSKLLYDAIDKHAGIGIKLLNDKNRKLTLKINNSIISFDSNRIFTKVGLNNSLLKLIEKHLFIALKLKPSHFIYCG